MAIAIAFVLNIPMKSIECFIKNKTKENNLIYKFSRTISILLTLIFLFIILFILGYIIIPQLIQTIVTLINNLTDILNGILENTDQLLKFFNLEGIKTEVNSETLNNFFTQFGLDFNNIIVNLTNMVKVVLVYLYFHTYQISLQYNESLSSFNFKLLFL